MSVNVAVGQRIQQARKAARLSQSDVGKRLQPSRTYAAVSQLESGQTAITIDVLFQLAPILGCTVAHLLEVDEPQLNNAELRRELHQLRLTWSVLEALCGQTQERLRRILDGD